MLRVLGSLVAGIFGPRGVAGPRCVCHPGEYGCAVHRHRQQCRQQFHQYRRRHRQGTGDRLEHDQHQSGAEQRTRRGTLAPVGFRTGCNLFGAIRRTPSTTTAATTSSCLQFNTAVALNTVTFTSGWDWFYDTDATISRANVNSRLARRHLQVDRDHVLERRRQPAQRQPDRVDDVQQPFRAGSSTLSRRRSIPRWSPATSG